MTVGETNSRSCIERTRDVSCSKPAVALTVIVALAIAIIGALVLVGILHSNTPFTALGKAIGQTGGTLMAGIGGTAALFILVGRICCFKARNVDADDQPSPPGTAPSGVGPLHPQNPPGPGGGGPTGAAGGSTDRSHVSFE